MARSVLCVLPILSLFMAGCLSQDKQSAQVPDSPFGHVPAAPGTSHSALAPASLAVAAKVDTIGHQIVKANPRLGLQPTFATLGAPQPEIFHRGKDAVVITEALAKQCTTDGQLAAVLCQELALMVAEREALAGPRARVPD